MVRFVVMAAGQATRMGRDKLALPWKESTVLAYVIASVFEAIEARQFDVEVLVVARQPLETYLSVEAMERFRALGWKWFQAPGPQPLADTVCMGLQELRDDVQEIGFLPGDQVGISGQSLSAILGEVIQTNPDFLVPMAGDKAGSPVFFHRRYLTELLALRGEQGGREVLYRHPELWRKFAVEEHFFQDVDTPEEYQAFFKQLCSLS